MRKTEKELLERWRKEREKSSSYQMAASDFQDWWDQRVWEYYTGAKEVQEARTKADGGS